MRRTLELARLALDGMRRRRLRAALTIAGVAIGTGALVSMLGYALGLELQLERSLELLGVLRQVEVHPRASAPEGAPRALDDAALAELERIPGVAAAWPSFRVSEVELATAAGRAPAQALGIPPPAQRLGLLASLLVAGRVPEPDEQALVLPEGLLEPLGWGSAQEALGQPVAVRARGLAASDGGSFELTRVEVQPVVVGVFRPPPVPLGLGQDVALLPADLIRRFPGTGAEALLGPLGGGGGPALHGYAAAVLQVDDPRAVRRVRAELERRGFASAAFDADEVQKAFLVLDLLLVSVGTVALVVAGLGIANTLWMSVLERVREVGLLKALGASNGDVRCIFLVEAALVGLIGGIGGVALGLAVSAGLELWAERHASALGLVLEVAAFRFPPWLLGGAVAFALALSLVSGLHPAIRAARLDAARSLQGG